MEDTSLASTLQYEPAATEKHVDFMFPMQFTWIQHSLHSSSHVVSDSNVTISGRWKRTLLLRGTDFLRLLAQKGHCCGMAALR